MILFPVIYDTEQTKGLIDFFSRSMYPEFANIIFWIEVFYILKHFSRSYGWYIRRQFEFDTTK